MLPAIKPSTLAAHYLQSDKKDSSVVTVVDVDSIAQKNLTPQKTNNPSCLKRIWKWIVNSWLITKISNLFERVISLCCKKKAAIPHRYLVDNSSQLKVQNKNNFYLIHSRYSILDYITGEFKQSLKEISDDIKPKYNLLPSLSFMFSLLIEWKDSALEQDINTLKAISTKDDDFQEKLEALIKQVEALKERKNKINQMIKELAGVHKESLMKSMEDLHLTLNKKSTMKTSDRELDIMLNNFTAYYQFFKANDLVTEEQLNKWKYVDSVVIEKAKVPPKLPQKPKKTNQAYIPPGVNNAGNTCYVDSGLQGIMSCQALRDAIVERHGAKAKIERTLIELEQYMANSIKDVPISKLECFISNRTVVDEIYDHCIIEEIEELIEHFRTSSAQDTEKAWQTLIKDRRALIKVLDDLKELNDNWDTGNADDLAKQVGKIRVTIFMGKITDEFKMNEIYDFQDAAPALGIILRAIDCDAPSVTIKEIIAPAESPSDPYALRPFRGKDYFMCFNNVAQTGAEAIQQTCVDANINDNDSYKVFKKSDTAKKEPVIAKVVKTSYKFKIKQNVVPSVLVVEWRDPLGEQRTITERDLDKFEVSKDAFYPALEHNVTYKLRSFAQRHPGHWTSMVAHDDGKWYRCDDLRGHSVEADPKGQDCGLSFYELVHEDEESNAQIPPHGNTNNGSEG